MDEELGDVERDSLAEARESLRGDELFRRKLADAGISGAELDEALTNLREPTAEELAAMPDAGTGAGVTWFADGSVVERHADGSQTVLRASGDDGPGGEVRDLDERRRGD